MHVTPPRLIELPRHLLELEPVSYQYHIAGAILHAPITNDWDASWLNVRMLASDSRGRCTSTEPKCRPRTLRSMAICHMRSPTRFDLGPRVLTWSREHRFTDLRRLVEIDLAGDDRLVTGISKVRWCDPDGGKYTFAPARINAVMADREAKQLRLFDELFRGAIHIPHETTNENPPLHC